MLTPTDWINLVTAVATAGAVLWAVFLYRRSVRDREETQARLLSPFGPVQLDSLQAMDPAGAFPLAIDDGVRLTREGDYGGNLVADPTQRVDIRVLSNSTETFSDLTFWLVGRGDSEYQVPCGEFVLEPGQDVRRTALFPLGVLPEGNAEGQLDLRVRFTDAAGLRWERTSRRPLRRLKRRRGRPQGLRSG